MSMLAQRDRQVILRPDGNGGYEIVGLRQTEFFSPAKYNPQPVYDLDRYLPRPKPAGSLAQAVGVPGLKITIALLIGCVLYGWFMHGSSGGTGSGTGKATDHTATGSINSTDGAMNPPPPASGNSGGNGGGSNSGATGSNSATATSSPNSSGQQAPHITNNYTIYNPYPQPAPPPPPTYYAPQPQPFPFPQIFNHMHRGR